MRKTLLTLFALSMLTVMAVAQSYNYHYWVDSNAPTSSSATGQKTFEVDISSLSNGIHALHVQALKGGTWSSVRTRYFLKATQSAATSARYWFDNDPSTIHNSVATTGSINLDVSQLGVGLHAVHYQLLGSNGPSAVRTRYFLINHVQTEGYSVRLSIDDGAATTYALNGNPIEIDIESLDAGTHVLHATLLDADNNVMKQTTHEFEKEAEAILVSGISFNISTLSLTVGESGTITASLTPQNATNKNLQWTSSNTAIATVTDGIVTAVAIGTATITATSTDGSNYSATCEVTVTASGGNNPATVEVTDITQLTDAIYINPVTGLIGNDIEVNICLKNAQDATAYVFDLQLPEGISVAVNDKGKYIDALSDRHEDHTRTFNDKGNNTYSLSTLSGNSEPLTGNDGAIRILTLHIADNMTEGVYALEIKNASYSKTDGTLIALPNTTSSITVEDYVLGDVNNNNGVDIGDAVSIVNYLVGKTSSTFVDKAADTNKNSQIDIGDAVTIVNYLVGKTTTLSRQTDMENNGLEPQ